MIAYDAMNIVLPIPDELAERLGASGNVERRALEAFGVAEYRAGLLTESELRRLLGFESRYELDGFLKERGLFLDYTTDDVRREKETFDRLGV